MVVHEELKAVNMIVKAHVQSGGNVLVMLKRAVDMAVEVILNE